MYKSIKYSVCAKVANRNLWDVKFKGKGSTKKFCLKRQDKGIFTQSIVPGSVAQSVMCLATDASLTADPGVASSIPARSHTFVEIDHEIISTVILLPSAESFKKGCCQLQAKVCAGSTG